MLILYFTLHFTLVLDFIPTFGLQTNFVCFAGKGCANSHVRVLERAYSSGNSGKPNCDKNDCRVDFTDTTNTGILIMESLQFGMQIA